MKQFEAFRLDTSNECLWMNGAQIALPPKQFAVLRYLVDNPGRLITHDELLDAVWPETYVQPQVLRTYVLELRKILRDDAREPRFIQSHPKRGYQFVARVHDHSPSPSASGPLLSTDLVGRHEALATLHAHFARLTQAQRQIVFITGDTGIGKTALVDAFRRSIDPSLTALVARGQCVQGFGQKEDYYSVMEALADLCASAESDKVRDIFARRSPAWLAALGNKSSASTPSAQDKALSEICGALEELAQEKPLLFILEDLHWADEATLQLVSALARRRAPARLMLLSTSIRQHGDVDFTLKRIKHDVLMHRLGAEVSLAPLRRPQVAELLQRALHQQELPSELAAFIHHHSEGNPLFANAILEHLIAQRFLVRVGNSDDGSWVQRVPFQEMEAGVPDELAQMIELEIEHLDPAEQRLLEAGSLFQIAFPAWAVAAALELDSAATEEACDALTRRLHFVKRAGQDELPDGTTSTFYVFAHGLYREVLYQRQSAAHRSQGHLRVAQHLSSLFTGREKDVSREIALHYDAAGNRRQAVATLRAAAHAVLQCQSYSSAEDLLEYALRIAEKLAAPEQAIACDELRRDLENVRSAMALCS